MRRLRAQTPAATRWVAVYHIVGTRSAFQSGCGRRGCVIDVHEAPYTLAIADNRDLLLADLLAHVTFAAVPRARAAEEAVSQAHNFDVRCARCRRFKLGISACAGSDGGRRIKSERLPLVSETDARCVPKAASLSGVARRQTKRPLSESTARYRGVGWWPCLYFIARSFGSSCQGA